MKQKLVVVFFGGVKPIADHPILRPQKEDPPLMYNRIFMAARDAVHKIEAVL